MQSMSLKLPLAGGLAVLLISLVWYQAAPGTPLYAARAGRTCDNCHLTPNGWENPSLSLRKCTLSCQSCHVDPAGGGLRNASGRFYGRATLPLVATSPRPTMDWDRTWAFPRMDKATTYTHELPLGPYRYSDLADTTFPVDDMWGKGTPLGSPERLSYFPGRYGVLNADPILRLGWDMRLAALFSQGAIAFPMQFDVAAAVHPVEHVSILANVGARGRTNGLGDTVDDPRTPYLREGFVLVHELPYMAYVKAGRFVPSYGLRLDDHTSSIRKEFEVNSALPEARVTGIEIGTNPNYPFLQASWFRDKKKDTPAKAFDVFDMDRTSGFALNAGFRETGWSVGGSALRWNRPLEEGGDATSFAAYGSWNPWFYSRNVPLTLQAEVDFGRFDRLSGGSGSRMAMYQEIDFLAGNGLNFLLKHDWEDPDRSVKDDEANRVCVGAQFTPVPGITLDTRIRALFPAGGQSGADMFLQLHLWN